MASAIGLDIGTSAVRAVQLSRSRKGLTLDRLGQVLLPPGAVADGEVVDPAAVADALRILMDRYRFKGRKVALGVANQQVVVRQVDLPTLPPDQLRQSLPLQVQDYIPIPIDQAQLDYELLEEYVAPDGTRMSRLLLVAAARSMVDSLLDVVGQAKLEPTLLDLDAFALLRALVGPTSGLRAEEGGTAGGRGEMVVNIGSAVTNIVIHDGGIPRFVRILLMGGGAITKALVAATGMDPEVAEDVKSQPQPQGGQEAQVIAERAQRFVDEVRGSLDYYRSQAGAIDVDRVVLSGGGALLPGLPDRLADAVRLPVDIGHPMQHLTIGKVGLEADQLAEAEPFVAVAIGLAMGGLEDS